MSDMRRQGLSDDLSTSARDGDEAIAADLSCNADATNSLLYSGLMARLRKRVVSFCFP